MSFCISSLNNFVAGQFLTLRGGHQPFYPPYAIVTLLVL
jgi:hypothetical protein